MTQLITTVTDPVLHTYFAEIDDKGLVLRVIVADQAFIASGKVGDPTKWVETSLDGALRKNYAGIGYQYNKSRDAFVTPKPFASWVLDEAKAQYQAPAKKPTGLYLWNEDKLAWGLVL